MAILWLIFLEFSNKSWEGEALKFNGTLYTPVKMKFYV